MKFNNFVDLRHLEAVDANSSTNSNSTSPSDETNTNNSTSNSTEQSANITQAIETN